MLILHDFFKNKIYNENRSKSYKYPGCELEYFL